MRLRQGRMEDVTIFADNPVDAAQRWVDEGARRLHLVDLNGAFAGEPVNADPVRAICKHFPDLPVQIGGGIRSVETAAYYIDAGVSFVIVGTRALQEPQFVVDLCREFPCKVIVGIDALNGKVATDGWANVSDVDALDLACEFANAGVASIVYTDISRDGMMQGVNVEATQRLAQGCGIPIIASGGITTLEDIKRLLAVSADGISAAITGRAIYEGTLDLAEAQACCDAAQGGV